MLKTSAHDGLPVLNCPNRWPLFKKHSGSDSSIYQSDPASIVFDSWTIPDVEDKPASYQSVKDIWWRAVWAERQIRLRPHSVTSAPSPPTFHQPPMEMVSTLTRPDLERMLRFFPLPQCSFQKCQSWSKHCRRIYDFQIRDQGRCAFSVVMSWLCYLWHSRSRSALQSSSYKGFIRLDHPGIYMANEWEEKHNRTKNNTNSQDLNCIIISLCNNVYMLHLKNTFAFSNKY